MRMCSCSGSAAVGRVGIGPTPAPEGEEYGPQAERALVCWREAQALHRGVRDAAGMDSGLRLSIARGALDRLEGIRDEIAWLVASVRGGVAELEDVYKLEDAGHASRARGASAEDRSASRMLMSRGSYREWRAAARHLGFLVDVDRAVRDFSRAVDGHRVEAITLLRAQSRISADEYAHGWGHVG